MTRGTDLLSGINWIENEEHAIICPTEFPRSAKMSPDLVFRFLNPLMKMLLANPDH
jgi:hypothetical protein